MGKNKWRHRNHYQNDTSSQQSDYPANGQHNQSRHNRQPPNNPPQIGSYTVTGRASTSNFSDDNPFQRRNPPQGPRNNASNFSNRNSNLPQGPRNAISNFSSDNPFQRNNRPQRPPNASTDGHDIARTPRGFDEKAFMLKSKHLKQHLLQSMNQNLREIQQWYPDEEENANDDEMDWQPETEILIPPPACEIRYVWDPEPAKPALQGVCSLELEEADRCQEPLKRGIEMTRRASETDLCMEKIFGGQLKPDRFVEMPKKGIFMCLD